MTHHQYTIFQNKGLIDIRAIKTFGVSSKEGDSPIGFFGTGLKYAIAICLREGLEIEILRGNEVLKFDTTTTEIRVDEFQIVTMNDQELGFTTDLGKKWQLWQAFRELYCNTLDEGGNIYTKEYAPPSSSELTTVVVKGRAMVNIYEERHKYFLETNPIATSRYAEAHGEASGSIFYRKIRAEETGKASLFTYNILSSLELTEDRTIKHDFYAKNFIARLILCSDNLQFVKKVLSAPKSYFEEALAFEDSYPFLPEPSKTFLEAVRQLRLDRTVHINPSALIVFHKALRITDELEPAELTNIEEAQLNRAIDCCKRAGFEVDKYPIIVIDFAEVGVLGYVENGKIILTKAAFLRGTKMVAGTLIEEYVHLKYGVLDETRPMQDALIDCMLSVVETHVLKEPI